MNRRTFLRRLLTTAGGLGLSGCVFDAGHIGESSLADPKGVTGSQPAGTAAPSAANALARTPHTQGAHPNVVLILADDLGWGDLGCYGQTKIHTPCLDRMAAEGMRFTQHYAGSTVCAPSRCCLMTGYHTGHAYVRGNRRTRGYDFPIPAGEFTLGGMFHQSGYRTACVGKWGLGGPDSSGHPNRQGFDYFYGYLGQGKAHSYYPEFLWENDRKIELDKKVYSHDRITAKALDFIEQQKDQPFFLYLPYTIPHAELVVPDDEILERYRAKGWPETPFPGRGNYGPQKTPHAAYAAMVSRMDRDIGRLHDTLARLDLDKNTLVLFTSDNGPHKEGGADPEFFRSAGPFRGLKRDLYEGGIRVPLLARWKGAIRPGSVSDLPSAFWDMMPTFAALSGSAPPDAIDGLSFLPELTGQGEQPRHEYLYWEFHEQGGKQAVRKGDWKALRLNVKKEADPPVELYNLATDPGETTDVASTHPDLARQLKALIHEAHTPSPIKEFKFHGE